MLSALLTIIRRDLLVAFRRRAELMNPILFYVIVVTLFPLGVSPDQEFLSQLAPGVVWVTALLAALISMESIFRQDFDDGSVEQLFLSQHPPTILILGKVIAHWLITGLPMLVIVPLMALLLYIPQQAIPTLFITVLIGTPILSLIGAIGVALTAGLRGGGVLLGLLVLPLYIPVLIFASGAVSAAIEGLPYSGHVAMLGAGLILALILSPLAISASLKISMS
ncbi:MAG: heme exporter protein CcmB [Gammaproteobacteria bacterium]|nr:heme exporter protein CcmB [Gammaproteobacteria bacterium]NNC68230.1 heme exporter protein CcmB [Gammaproteobacteria bacterium]